MTGKIPTRKRYHPKHNPIMLVLIAALLAFLCGCQSSSVIAEPDLEFLENIPPGFTVQDIAALSTLEQIDDYPLYTMAYAGDLILDAENAASERYEEEPAWACSLFAAYGDSNEILYGRNFDWDFSPALLLFMDPPDGYASISMVDIFYLGYKGDGAFGITGLPLEEQAGLLDAPYIPFDGMNEAGLAVGMAAVPPGEMVDDPNKETIDSLMVIRKVLDGAATVDEAVKIMGSYNIDMVGTPVHYLISERSGRSALVEFSKGEMVVLPNENKWQMATNFLLSETRTDPDVHCGRYTLIQERLVELDGQINPRQAMALLEDVAQPSTQWSVVYRVSAGEVWVVMGGEYHRVHKISSGFE